MTVQSFVDTNILVYAASRDLSERAIKARALELIASTEFGISAQVLAEFYLVSTRKVAVPLAAAAAMEWIELLEQQPCVPIDAGPVKQGAALSARYQISYCDGAIIAAAEALGAATVYSVDLNHGQTYGPVQIVNPFK